MLRQQLPGHSVELAFLELMQPTLLDAVASLVSRGELIIKIVPVFFGRGGHLKNDYPVLLKQLASIHPQVSIVSTEAVGQWDAVWQAIASEIVATL